MPEIYASSHQTFAAVYWLMIMILTRKKLIFFRNSSATNIAMRKVAVSLADSVDLRTILSVLYIITEVIRAEKVAASDDYRDIAEQFTSELSK